MVILWNIYCILSRFWWPYAPYSRRQSNMERAQCQIFKVLLRSVYWHNARNKPFSSHSSLFFQKLLALSLVNTVMLSDKNWLSRNAAFSMPYRGLPNVRCCGLMTSARGMRLDPPPCRQAHTPHASAGGNGSPVCRSRRAATRERKSQNLKILCQTALERKARIGATAPDGPP